MERVVVGSTNPVKVRAAAIMFEQLFPGIAVSGAAVPSGVAVQPIGDDETIQGAINRATAALEATDAEWGVGLEGGVAFQGDECWLIQHCAIVTRDGRVGIGNGPRFLLPPAVGRAIRNGGEVGPLFDQLTGEKDTKKKGGAIGFLTHGLVLREHMYSLMVAGALVRFLHPTLYEGGE